jgi:hypothetical protein
MCLGYIGFGYFDYIDLENFGYFCLGYIDYLLISVVGYLYLLDKFLDFIVHCCLS